MSFKLAAGTDAKRLMNYSCTMIRKLARLWWRHVSAYLCADEAVANVFQAGSSCRAHQPARRCETPRTDGSIARTVMQREQRRHPSTCNTSQNTQQRQSKQGLKHASVSCMWYSLHGQRAYMTKTPQHCCCQQDVRLLNWRRHAQCQLLRIIGVSYSNMLKQVLRCANCKHAHAHARNYLSVMPAHTTSCT
jgi:hypothetical protein